jgi:magnesium chelatase accessory protein
VTGERDGMIPPREAEKVQALLPRAELRRLPGLGHLAHEEAPAVVAALILARAGTITEPVPS